MSKPSNIIAVISEEKIDAVLAATASQQHVVGADTGFENSNAEVIHVENPMKLTSMMPALNVTISDTTGVHPPILSDLEMERINQQKMEAEIDALLIYTKAVKWPTITQSLTERRFIVRVFQLFFGLGTLTILMIGAFLDMGSTALINNYTSVVLESSGIPFFCFVSITSIVPIISLTS